MRSDRHWCWLGVFCSLIAPIAAIADEKTGQPAVEPIKVIELARREPVSYQKDIEPILINKCAVCHAGKIQEGELDMSSYERLMKGGQSGKPIVPGKASKSLLVKLAGRTARPTMPPKTEKPLSPEELALIKLWIDQGAKPPGEVRERARVVLGVPPAGVHPVRARAVTPNKAIVAAGRGNQIHLFDGTSGDFQRSIIDPDLTASDRKAVKAAHLSLVESLAVSPDGKLLASGSFQEVVLWDVQSGALKQRLTGFAERVVSLAFSADGKYLATGGGAPAEDGEIKIYEVGENKGTGTGGPGVQEPRPIFSAKLIADVKNGHSDTVFGVCFSPDGTRLAACGADKFVKVFEVPSGKFIKSFEGHTHHVLDVGWKGDGKLLASAGADNLVKVWDFDKGEQVRTINAHGKQVTRLVFIGKTAQFVTCSGDQTVKLWNVDNGAAVRTLPGGKDFFHALAVSADGTLVAAGDEDGKVLLYNGVKGQLVKTVTPSEK